MLLQLMLSQLMRDTASVGMKICCNEARKKERRKRQERRKNVLRSNMRRLRRDILLRRRRRNDFDILPRLKPRDSCTCTRRRRQAQNSSGL